MEKQRKEVSVIQRMATAQKEEIDRLVAIARNLHEKINTVELAVEPINNQDDKRKEDRS